MKTVLERFLGLVEKTETHWLWIGQLDSWGYGRLGVDRKPVLAHRVAYELFKGPIPEGLKVLHKPPCNVRSCVNPDHLYVGTQLDNAHDRESQGRTAHSNRHGSHTHPERWSCGEKQGSHKLTEIQVQEIRDLRNCGVTFDAIAKKFRVSVPTIESIIRGDTWKHVRERK